MGTILQGLLVSQIGYDLDEQKHAIFRHTNRDGFPDDAAFSLTDISSGQLVFSGQATY